MTTSGSIHRAAGAIILAMTIIGLIDNFVVYIAQDAGLWQFHLVRSMMSLPMIALWARLTGVRLRPRSLRPVLGRSFAVAVAMVLYFGALGFLTVEQAAAGLFTSPIFVLALSVILFRQRVGWRRMSAVGLGFLGVLLVLRPETGGLSLVHLMPLAAGAFYGLGVLATREWCDGEETLSLLFAFFATLGTLAGLGVIVTSFAATPEPSFLTQGWVMPTPAFLGWTFVQALGSVVAVWFLTRGYQMVAASRIAGFEYSLLVAAAAWGFVLFGQTVSGLAVFGMVLIVASGLILARRNAAAQEAHL